MKKQRKKKRSEPTDSPEQVSADEARKRMKAFIDRREKFVAAVKKSQN